MRVPACLLALIFLLFSLSPSPAEDCGAIDRTGATIGVGDAPAEGEITIEACRGPGFPEERRAPELNVNQVSFLTNWAYTSTSHLGEQHETDESQTLPGGRYLFPDNLTVPAGVTLTYTGSVTLIAVNRANIYGTVRTDTPGAGIRISAGKQIHLEGTEFTPAMVETLGTDSPIEIGSLSQVRGSFRSGIRAEHGDILISGKGSVDGASGVHLTSTDVRARSGSVEISAVKDVVIRKGYFEGNGGGIALRSTAGRIDLADLIMDVGIAGPGIDIGATHDVKLSGQADLMAGAGSIELKSKFSSVRLIGAYSIYTDSGDQIYQAKENVEIDEASTIASNTGSIHLRGRGDTVVGPSVLVQSSTVTSVSGEIRVTGTRRAKFSGDALVHSDLGLVRIDARSVDIADGARLGRGIFSSGPIEVRCGSLDADATGPQSHVWGSRVEVHLGNVSSSFGAGLLRAEAGDVVIRSEAPVAFAGIVEARGDIRIETEEELDLTGATIRTDDRTEGASGSISLKSWGGTAGRIDLPGATVETGDGTTGSGDIEILVGVGVDVSSETPWILPKRVTLKLNDRDPARSRITVSGHCDLGTDAVDLGVATSLEIGGLEVAVPGLSPNGSGSRFQHKADGLTFTVSPSKTGSSLAKFKLVYRGDLSGKVDPAADLTIRFDGGGLSGVGTVRLTDGKYALRKVPGTLVEPGLYLARAKVGIKGVGKDKLSLLLGLTTGGGTPAEASDLTFEFGEDLSVTIPGESFVKHGDRFQYRGDVDGITRIVLDYARETIKVKGKGLSIGTFPDGPSTVDISLTLGEETRAVGVRMVRSGKRLRY